MYEIGSVYETGSVVCEAGSFYAFTILLNDIEVTMFGAASVPLPKDTMHETP